MQVSLTFKVSEDLDPSKLDRMHNTECPCLVGASAKPVKQHFGRYPDMSKLMGSFRLDIKAAAASCRLSDCVGTVAYTQTGPKCRAMPSFTGLWTLNFCLFLRWCSRNTKRHR